MQFFQQLSQLLSQPPSNIVFHLVTLFALQAVFAIAFGHVRRHPKDAAAQRVLWAAGAIFLARVWLLVAGLIVANNPAIPPIIPPLEQALNTVTAVFLIWSLAPQSSRWPRLSDTALTITLILIGVLYAFFAQAWRDLALDGASYNDSRQALFWNIFQTMALAIGTILVLARHRTRRSLRPLVLVTLLLAHTAQLFIPAEQFLPESTNNTMLWLRLGHLIAFPLWVAFIYRHTLHPLLRAHRLHRPATKQLTDALEMATQIIKSPDETKIVVEAVQMAQNLIAAPFLGIALLDDIKSGKLHLISNLPQPGEDHPQNWYLQLNHWPALRMSIEHQQMVELIPDGLGARQLYQLYEEMGLPLSSLSPLLIQPLTISNTQLGVLIMAREEQWNPEIKQYIETISNYIGQTIYNGRLHTKAIQDAASIPVLTAQPEGEARIITLEDENKQLQDRLQLSQDRLHQEKQRATTARKQARDLAATITELERVSTNDRQAALQSEVEILRESLIQAEEALAMASSADSGLSTEWVMQAITRYSGELEEAQGRIEYLEMELRNRRDDSPRYNIIASLAEELRTPLTSISGYTDLLISSSPGRMGTRQQDFLQRIRTNTQRLDTVLNQLVQLAAVNDEPAVQPEPETVDVSEVVESAIHTVIGRIQEKNLRLDLNIPDVLAPLEINREALQQILVNLLSNACQTSQTNGRIAINAYTQNIETMVDSEPISFVHLTIGDSGYGISAEDQARVFDPQLQADTPLIEGLGDKAAGLAVARKLTQAHGGRIWVDSEVGKGSIFSVVFPLQSKNGKH